MAKGSFVAGDKAPAAKGNGWSKSLKGHWEVYLMLLIPLVLIVIFAYGPMMGLVISVQDFSVKRGIFGSSFVGLKYFRNFFGSPLFGQLVGNTLKLSLYSLAVGFPIPIILAIFLNESRLRWFKKSVQTITYMPYFISTVVLVGLMFNFFHHSRGLVNTVISAFGGDMVNFTGDPAYFRTMYVLSGVWQTAGYSAIIYISALAGVSPELIEAGVIDGTSRWQKIWHIDLPAIAPTITIMLILAMGSVFNVGFEKVYLMQNPLNIDRSEIISTYVYKRGLLDIQYSYSTAIGLFNSVINTALLVLSNFAVRRLGGSSLF